MHPEKDKKPWYKSPLAIGSSIATAAVAIGTLALSRMEGEPREIRGIGEDTRAKIEHVLNGGSIKHAVVEVVRIKKIEDMLAGDADATEWILDQISNDLRTMSDEELDRDDAIASMFAKYGLTRGKWFSLTNAKTINKQRSITEDPASPPDTDNDYEYAHNADRPWGKLLGALSKQAMNGDPFDPLFLKHLNMTEQELKDFVLLVISYVEDNGIYQYGVWYESKDDVAFLRKKYEIE